MEVQSHSNFHVCYWQQGGPIGPDVVLNTGNRGMFLLFGQERAKGIILARRMHI
jgi:hypothetical protein